MRNSESWNSKSSMSSLAIIAFKSLRNAIWANLGFTSSKILHSASIKISISKPKASRSMSITNNYQKFLKLIPNSMLSFTLSTTIHQSITKKKSNKYWPTPYNGPLSTPENPIGRLFNKKAKWLLLCLIKYFKTPLLLNFLRICKRKKLIS